MHQNVGQDASSSVSSCVRVIAQRQRGRVEAEPDANHGVRGQLWDYWSNGRLRALVDNQRLVGTDLSAGWIKDIRLDKRRLGNICLVTGAHRWIGRSELVRSRQALRAQGIGGHDQRTGCIRLRGRVRLQARQNHEYASPDERDENRHGYANKHQWRETAPAASTQGRS